MATYVAGDIPTSFVLYDSSCNGPVSTLSVILPDTGSTYSVTNVHVSYNMTAIHPNYMSDQRSKIKFQNANEEEDEVSGVGDAAGTYYYGRDLSLANGTYPGGTELVFQLWANRLYEGIPGCNTLNNKVDNQSWTITVFVEDVSRVGVGTVVPAQKLDVHGKIQVRDDPNAPTAGTIRWNSTTNDFEGFDGEKWRSFTGHHAWGKNEVALANENQRLYAANGPSFASFGGSVSISNEYAIAGSSTNTVNSNVNQGSANIFVRAGETWSEQAWLAAADGSASDRFGFSVSISGDYAVVGAPFDDMGGNTNQGSAYVFVRSGGMWTEQIKLTASDGTSNDQFGRSVYILGDYIIIGAYLDDIGGNDSQGSAYIFIRNGSSWSEQTKLISSDGGTDDRFGQSVSLAGNYAVVGSYRDDIDGKINQGSAYIFVRNMNTWTEQSKLVAPDGSATDEFGWSVAIADDYVVVGAPRDTVDNNPIQGAAFVYYRTGSAWIHQATLSPSIGLSNIWFGYSVALDGNYIVAGAVFDKIGNSLQQGSAYIFIHNGISWTEQTKVTASDGENYDNFGTSVSMSDGFILVGSPEDDVLMNEDQGSIHFFKKN